MKDNDLKKLSRSDLLEILIMQGKEIERLKTELAAAKKELKDREIDISRVGSLAEASLKLNGIFEAADAAAKQYLESLKLMDLNSQDVTLALRDIEKSKKENNI